MLVLSRKKNESILIGDCIRVVVVDVRGDKARIAIEAPQNMRIWRGELLEKMYMQPQEVASADGG